MTAMVPAPGVSTPRGMPVAGESPSRRFSYWLIASGVMCVGVVAGGSSSKGNVERGAGGVGRGRSAAAEKGLTHTMNTSRRGRSK